MITIHPLSEVFPAMSEEDFEGLKDSIAANGVREPVVIHEGQVVDGRHRWQACQELGIECPTVLWNGSGSLVDYVLDINLNRRQLTPSQRAAVAVEILPYYEAEAAERKRLGTIVPRGTMVGRATEHAAKATGASGRLVARAKSVAESSPELAAKVKSGGITVTAAAKQVEAQNKAKPQRPVLMRDGAGRVVSDPDVQAAMNSLAWFSTVTNELHLLKRQILAEASTSHGGKIRTVGIEADFQNIVEALKFARPYTTCPYTTCATRGCQACGGRKWLTQDEWNAVPADIRGES